MNKLNEILNYLSFKIGNIDFKVLKNCLDSVMYLIGFIYVSIAFYTIIAGFSMLIKESLLTIAIFYIGGQAFWIIWAILRIINEKGSGKVGVNNR